jgi:cytochrome P450
LEYCRPNLALGPIVRVTPHEVHIKDPNYYDEIYASSKRRRQKDASVVARFDLDGSAFSTVSPEDHRQRRAHLEKYFSKQSVTNMEYLIHENIDKLDQHFKRAYESHKAISLDAGFAGLASDVIHKYAYGFNSGNLDHEDFNEKVRDGLNGLFKFTHVLLYLPILVAIMRSTPLWLLEKIDPFVYALMDQKAGLLDRTRKFLGGKPSGSKPHPIMEVITGPSMPEHLRQAERLNNEGFSLVIGGTETTARSLAIGAFRLISDKHIRTKLREELRTVMPTPDSRPTWNQLEQLPYLVGFMCNFEYWSTC